MVRSLINLVLVGVCAGLSACAQQVQQKEDMLAAAQASLAALPSHKFTHQVRNNVAVITYADPTVCDCLYVGNQAAYDSYRQAVKAKNLAAAPEEDAKLADWGVWPALGP